MTPDFDVVVIGAGAAGMMCAATAGHRGRRVLLLDHATTIGEKIRISGGGRCNFTNLHATWRDYLSENPDFCRSALARYQPADFIALVERHGIAYHEKTLGQLFCDGSAKQVVEMLKAECAAGNVEWALGAAPLSLGSGAGGGGFSIALPNRAIAASSLVIATGGLTVPRIGATPFAYRVAGQFGLAVVPPKPALVPLAFAPELLQRYGDLAGVSLDAEVRCGKGKFREALLFTHRGLSGPAILQASSYWQQLDGREPLRIDLLPGLDTLGWLAGHRRSKEGFANLLATKLPKRFAQSWCEAHGATRPAIELPDAKLREVAESLSDWRVMPVGTLGYNKAEVTLGGVDTRGLSSKTMEALGVPGLFFIGEAVDVTGHLGGFNFQWAWASGHAAGEAA